MVYIAAPKPPSQVVVFLVPVAFLFPVRTVFPELRLFLGLPVRVTYSDHGEGRFRATYLARTCHYRCRIGFPGR